MSSQQPAVARTAVVTGAASGIGRATARKLTAAGMRVIAVDRDRIDDSFAAVRQVNLGERDALGRLCEELRAARPPVDVLVNVAGIYRANEGRAFDPNAFSRVLDVNLYAPTLLSTAVGPGMCDRGWGRIVNVTSVHAIVSEPGAIAYNASKNALGGVTRTLAIEWASHGVLVNAVAPGFTATRMSVIDGKNELESDWFRDIYLDGGRLPIGRHAEPEEIAAVIAWLVSAENTYVSGATIVADGGLTTRL